MLLILITSTILTGTVAFGSGSTIRNGIQPVSVQTALGAAQPHTVAADHDSLGPEAQSGHVELNADPAVGISIPPGVLYYAPITASNGQPVSTETPFDLSFDVNCKAVAGYADANLQNVEFFAPNGTVLASWHQSGICVDYPAYANYWVNLPSGIAANSNYTFYIGFGAPGTNLLNDRNTGVAPGCYGCAPAAPYGTYDDGTFVFPFYQAWGGLSTLPAAWTVQESGGNSLSFDFQSTQTVVSLTSTSGGATLFNSTTGVAAVDQPLIWETYGAFDNPDNGVANSQGLISTEAIMESYGGASNLGCFFPGEPMGERNFGTDSPGNHLYAIEVTNVSTTNWTSDIYQDGNPVGCSVSGQSVQSPVTDQGFIFPTSAGQASGAITLNWTAILTFPPNGVMPSVAMGAVALVPTPYDVAFTESGLPLNASWSVTLNGGMESTNNSTISFAVPNGTYEYTIDSLLGYYTSPASGSVVISGSSLFVGVPFSPVAAQTSTIVFSETGLPIGTPWSVTLSGLTANSTGSSISFSEPNGTYIYAVESISMRYRISPVFECDPRLVHPSLPRNCL